MKLISLEKYIEKIREEKQIDLHKIFSYKILLETKTSKELFIGKNFKI